MYITELRCYMYLLVMLYVRLHNLTGYTMVLLLTCKYYHCSAIVHVHVPRNDQIALSLWKTAHQQPISTYLAYITIRGFPAFHSSG